MALQIKVKLAQLPDAGPLTGTELSYGEQNGEPVKITESQRGGLPTPNQRLVITGDSISNNMVEDWPAWISINSYFSKFNIVNYAIAGKTVAEMVTEYPTKGHVSRPTPYTTDNYWFAIYGGINDLSADDTATNIYNNLKSLWASARTDGYKVMAFTLMDSTELTGPQQTQREALNSLILSDQSLFDILIRPDLVLSPVETPSLFADGLHPNETGSKLFAKVISNTFDTRIASLFSNSGYGNEPTEWIMQLLASKLGIGGTPESILDLIDSTPVLTIRNLISGTFYGVEFKKEEQLEGHIKMQPSTGEMEISAGRSVGWGSVIKIILDTVEKARFLPTGEFLMGTTTRLPCALMVLNSTTQGFMPPRMTTTQRDAISSLQEGLIIFNTTTHKHEGYDGTSWNEMY